MGSKEGGEDAQRLRGSMRVETGVDVRRGEADYL